MQTFLELPGLSTKLTSTTKAQWFRWFRTHESFPRCFTSCSVKSAEMPCKTTWDMPQLQYAGAVSLYPSHNNVTLCREHRTGGYSQIKCADAAITDHSALSSPAQKICWFQCGARVSCSSLPYVHVCVWLMILFIRSYSANNVGYYFVWGIVPHPYARKNEIQGLDLPHYLYPSLSRSNYALLKIGRSVRTFSYWIAHEMENRDGDTHGWENSMNSRQRCVYTMYPSQEDSDVLLRRIPWPCGKANGVALIVCMSLRTPISYTRPLILLSERTIPFLLAISQ